MARPLKPLVHSGGWYPSKKWIPLVRNGGYTTQNGGEPPVNWSKVSGVPPLSLPNAAAYFINSLKQVGKCTVSGTDITCNNGKLVAVDDELPSGYERQIGFVFAASTYYLISGFYLRGSDTVRFSFSADKACNVFGCYTTNSATDNYSLYASTSSGGKYLRYDGATYNSFIPSAQIGERIDAVITPTGTSGMPTDSVITPAEFEATADLCIGTTSTSASSSKLDGNIWGNFIVDGRLTLIPCKRLSDDALGYYDLDSDTFYEPVGSAPTSLGVDTSHLTALSVDGTPEVLTVGEQTATVENLLAVDDIKDEQNIISGAVTRRCEAVISDGTTPSGRYIGEVGEGNIIVKVRETGYEGDVVTFEADRAEPLNGLTVNVEPIQDLHGYDSPWPDGGGKNLWDYSDVVSGTNFSITLNSDNSVTITGTPDRNYQNLTKIIDITNVLEDGEQYTLWMSSYTDLTNICYPQVVGERADTTKVYLTANGRDKTFQVDKSTFVKYTIYLSAGSVAYWGASRTITEFLQLEKGSSKTSFAPYSNICPISGRTSATVTRTGINIFDKSEVVDNAYINENDGTERPANGSKCTGWISVVPGEKYYILTEQTAGAWGSWYDRNKSFISPITGYLPSGSQKEQTAPSNAAYMRLTCVRNGSGNIDTFSVNYPSTDHNYHPYQGNTYTVTLGDTVYGGTLDVTGGKMVVDMAMVDLGTLTWSRGGTDTAGIHRFSSNIPTVIAESGSAIPRMLCSQYATVSPNKTFQRVNGVSNNLNIGQVMVFDDAYSNGDVAAFKAAMSGVQLCYELATPFEITLTPTQIETLIGTNNIWSDAGTVKAYVADGDLIEHVTAQTMRTAEGTNTVSVTSNVDPVELSVEYAIAVGE